MDHSPSTTSDGSLPMSETMTAGAQMAAEIAEQPDVLARLLGRATEIEEVAAAVRRRKPRFVLLAARGTSDHAALYAKYLVEIRLGLPAGLVSPSTMTLYKAKPDLSDVLFVAVSQSGGSPDLAESTAVARECGATTVALTNVPGSPVHEAADFSFALEAGEELAVAATKSYTAELLALYLLLGGDPAGAAALPAAAAATLDNAAAVHAAAARYRFANRLVTTGRGYSYPSAREGALKLMETSYLSAHAFSTADLLHGPVAMLDSNVPLIAVLSGDAGGDSARAAVDRLRDTGTDVLVVGPDAGERGLALVTEGVVPELAPVLEILPLQQFAWRLALDRGADPDRPRGLAKVTRTR
ncbi:glutamine-fructose-6-phosphate transaminase [Virgisporangium aliadipatigenens]|uniref:Glutamine-fructose-6-phosphate transaminase n=2 Tax=Virgisporangium aliadipatigenens TaxID=741659 RepID=A0A8J4DRH7_9ACTN|nr:glutamine-fructose-6-phosphate transaminase [Virgisporangium aliadipatigenens]